MHLSRDFLQEYLKWLNSISNSWDLVNLYHTEDQIPDNNYQRMLGLIEGLSTGVSQVTRNLPNSISNSWNLASRHIPMDHCSKRAPCNFTQTTSHLSPCNSKRQNGIFFKLLDHVNIVLLQLFLVFPFIYHLIQIKICKIDCMMVNGKEGFLFSN